MFKYYRSPRTGIQVREVTKKTASENVDEEEIVIDVDEPENTIEDLPGVGPATAEKLREAGFEELLTDLGHGDLATQILEKTATLQDILAQFDGSLFEAITEGTNAPEALLVQFSALIELVKQDMVTVLHLRVPNEAAGDND